jgi:hypothetical protein
MGSSSDTSITTNKDSVICPWCKTYYEVRPGTNCTNCGGALPPPAGPDRGEVPPPAPRMFPDGYKRKIIYNNNWFMYIGAVIVLINFPTSFNTIQTNAIFLAIGIYMLWKGYDKAKQKVDVLEHGKAVEGFVVEAGENQNMSVNEKHPYFIKYEYEVNGKKYTSSMNCWDESSTSFNTGDPVWVVYTPTNLEYRSSLWPPVA